MKKSDFYYDLPEELIAQTPIEPRDHSRLMQIDRNSGEIQHKHFYDLLDILQPGDLLVMNDSRVLPARLYGEKVDNGTFIEFLLLEQKGDKLWEIICRPGKKAKVGVKFSFGGGRLIGEVVEVKPDGNRIVQFTCEGNFYTALEEVGQMPLPPYIHEKLKDKERYQTVYSKIKGSVAAPTAGLHFTDNVLASVDSHGVDREEITLHVGAGTFKPVKSEEIGGHDMHSEFICVHRSTIEKLIQHGGHSIAVGTTSVRTLESLYYVGIKTSLDKSLTEEELHVGQWEPYDDSLPKLTSVESMQAILQYMDANNVNTIHFSTQIIIVPGYEYKIVNMLVTNFHQPQSTLLLLVSAFLHGDWKRIYDYALAHDFRFLSYGDSSLLIP